MGRKFNRQLALLPRHLSPAIVSQQGKHCAAAGPRPFRLCPYDVAMEPGTARTKSRAHNLVPWLNKVGNDFRGANIATPHVARPCERERKERLPQVAPSRDSGILIAVCR